MGKTILDKFNRVFRLNSMVRIVSHDNRTEMGYGKIVGIHHLSDAGLIESFYGKFVPTVNDAFKRFKEIKMYSVVLDDTDEYMFVYNWQLECIDEECDPRLFNEIEVGNA